MKYRILALALLGVFVACGASAQIVYVDQNAAGAGDGSSWANAFTTIQAGINAAYSGGGGMVWVARGVYSEARTELWGCVQVSGSLVLKSGVQLYGGFEGIESSLSQRAPFCNQTVIDGSTSLAGGPAFHVVVVGGNIIPDPNCPAVPPGMLNTGVVMDGFHVVGGRASGIAGDYHTWRGAGLYNWATQDLTVANCVFYDNIAAVSGGAVANETYASAAADATYENCLFVNMDGLTNIAQCLEDDYPNPPGTPNPIRGGGGMFNNMAAPEVIYCTFSGNQVGVYAGWGAGSAGMLNWDDSPAVNSSIFWEFDYIVNIGVQPFDGGASLIFSDYCVPGYTCPGFAVSGPDPCIALWGAPCGTGNLSVPPVFDPMYMLTAGSPCIDMGDPASPLPNRDAARMPRPVAGAGVCQVDMGAYEFSPVVPNAVCQPATIDVEDTPTILPAILDGGSTVEVDCLAGTVSGLWKRTLSQDTFSCADASTTPINVTLTVYDFLCRTDSCVAQLTVSEDTAPVAGTVSGAPAYVVASTPLPITLNYAGASDACSGLASVELWYQVNGGGWALSTAAAGTTASGTFAFNDFGAQGLYEFATVSVDNIGNTSGTPTAADDSTVYDTTAPVPTIVRSFGTPTNADVLEYDVDMGESVGSSFDASDITPSTTLPSGVVVAVVDTGDHQNFEIYLTTNDGDEEGTVSFAITGTVTDLAGNPVATPVNSPVFDVDNTAPTCAGIVLDDPTPTNADSVDFSVDFDESVTDFTEADVTLEAGSVPSTIAVTGGPQNWTVTVTPNDPNSSGTIAISIGTGITDIAGNAFAGIGPSAAYTLDNDEPGVTISRDDANPTNADAVDFSVDFDEEVGSTFTAGDITVNTTLASGAVASVVDSGDHMSFTVTLTVNAGGEDGTLGFSITGSVTDAVGNAVVVPAVSPDYTIDNTPPTLPAGIVLTDPNPTNLNTVNFALTFDEPVTGFVSGVVTVNGVASGAPVVSNGPMSWNVAVSPTDPNAEGTLGITIGAGITDLAGNPFAGAGPSADYTLDNTRPMAIISRDGASPTNADSVAFSVDFNESVGTSFTAADVTVTPDLASASVAVVDDPVDDMTFTVTVTPNDPNEDGFIGIEIAGSGAVTDLAGNGYLGGSAPNDYELDNTAPTVDEEDPGSGTTVVALTAIKVKFDEAMNASSILAGDVSYVRDSDPAVTASSVAGPDGNGWYTFTVADCANGSITVTYAAGNAADAVGNLMAGDHVWSFTRDDTVPVAVLASGDVSGGYSNASPVVSFTVTWSESVTGFDGDPGDVVVGGTTGGTWSNFAGSGASYSFDVTPAGQGQVTVQIPAGVATGSSGVNPASNMVTFIYDTVAPTVTVNTKVTGDSTPSLSGTVDDVNATILVTVDTQVDIPATNLGDGTWRLADDTLTALAHGVYDVQVTATDLAGNDGNDATTDELTVDLVAPVVTVDTLATTDNTPPLSGTVDDPAATIVIAVGAQTGLAATNNGDGTWTLADDTLTALADGYHDVVATATDAVGNSDSDVTVNELLVDTTGPVLTLEGPSDVTVSCGDGYTDEGATGLDNVDGDVTGSIVATVTDSLSNPVPGGIVDVTPPDVYTITYNVSDTAGNPATPVTRTVTVLDDCPLSIFVVGGLAQEGMLRRSYTFEVQVSNNLGPVTYQWAKDDGAKAFQPIAGETDATFTIASLDYDDAGSYMCTAADSVTSVDSDTIVFTVVKGTPVAGTFGLGLLAALSALGGAMTIRRKRK